MSIQVRNMVKRFGRTEVLRGIDLSVEKGELLALLGPSGSGKTTLLKIFAGLEWPDSGALQVDGQDWLQLPAQQRRTGFVFQHYALFPHMTVRENVAFGLTVLPRAQRPAKARIAAKVAELLDFLQIGHLADRFPAALSGGQRQRVALGRALAIEPKLLLLDEPFGALDAAIRRDLRRWLRQVHEATGSTTIIVTHDQEEASELADRIVVMGEGRIEQIGSADHLHDYPANPFVARFIGATVEMPVSLHAGRAERAGWDLTRLDRVALPDGSATLFLRPAEITVLADPGGRSRVTDLVSTGGSLRLRITDPAGAEVEAEVPRGGPHAARLAAGAAVTLRPEGGRLFPMARGEAAPVVELSRFKERSR